jgi:hypothetical protein
MVDFLHLRRENQFYEECKACQTAMAGRCRLQNRIIIGRRPLPAKPRKI